MIKEDLIQNVACLDKGKEEEKGVKADCKISSLDKQEDDGTDMGKTRRVFDFSWL